MDNPDLPTLQPWRPTVGPPAQVFVVGAEPLLPPGGRAGPAASLHRPPRHDPGGAGRHPGEDVDGRGRSPGAVSVLRPGPVPPEERAARRLPRLPLEHRRALHGGHLPESDDERAGHAQAPPRPALPPGALARPSTGRRSTTSSTTASGLPGQNTVLRSPAGHEEPRMAYARFDLAQANRLLDEMGLTARDSRGFRLRPDGRRLDLIVETSGDETEHTDVLELVKDTWARAGDRAPDPPEPARGVPAPGLLGRGHDERLQRELRVRPPHARHEPGLARAGEPAAAPVAQVGARTSRARATRARRRRSRPPGAWSSSTSGGSCRATPTSGPASGRRCSTSTPRRSSRSASSGGTLQPIVVKNGLRGVPAKGVYSWEPGSHFGIYNPDTFYWENGHR